MTLLLGSAIAVNINGAERFDDPSYVGLTTIIITTYVFTLVMAFWLPRVKNLVPIAHVSFGYEALCATALVMMTGMLESPFSFFFVITALFGGVTMGRHGGLAAACYAVMGLFLVLLVTQGVITLPGVPIWMPEWSSAQPLYKALPLSLAVLGAGTLSGALAERLERTERDLARSEQGLRTLENMHQHVLESLPAGVLTLDLDGSIVYANPSALTITQLASDALLGRTLQDLRLVPTSNPNRVVEAALGEQARWECQFQRDGDGDERVLSMGRSMFGGGLGFIVTVQDITELRRAEEEIRQRERLSTLGRFSARLAHEVRNPLTSISGAVEMLSDSMDGDDAILMEIISREVDRLNALLRQTLDYARPGEFPSELIDLTQLTNETAYLFRHDALAQHVTLSLDVPSQAMASFNSEAMRQVLWNLWRNAAEAIEDEGLIRTEVVPQGAWWRVSVSDDGPGIPEDVRATIFEPFFTTKVQGTGLGLATVHQLLTEQGGGIRLLDSPKGTCFELMVPRPADVQEASPHHTMVVTRAVT